MRTVGPILVSSSRPDEVTRLINAQYYAQASSSALQETDLSVPPLGLDIQDNEPSDSFRRQTLLSLDLLKGILLALLAGESIQMFLRSEEESDENWYSKQDRWTESPLYALRLAANPAAPGLMILGGIGVVLFQQSRLQLGWSRADLLRHSALRAAALMCISILLTIDFTVREDGPNLIQNLILWPFGINLFLLGCTTIGLLTLERRAISRYIKSHPPETIDPFSPSYEEEGDEDQVAIARAENYAHHLGNAILLALSSLLFAMNMLAVPKQGTSAGDRSAWFWFWIMPMPSQPDRMYHTLVNQYAPLNWLPFGLIGVVFARYLTRRERTKFALSAIHGLLSIFFATLFVLTRLLKFGNLSTHLLPDHPKHPDNPYLESWQAFLYTVKFPPDLAYSSLCLGVNSLLFALIMLCKTEWREKSPLLQFGRSPVFFYVANLLVFRFVSSFALTFFGLPPKLDLGPALTCYFGTLIIVWFLCRGYIAFKDSRNSPDSIWRFF